MKTQRNKAKTITRISALLLAVLMAAAFCGCGRRRGNDADKPVNTEPLLPTAEPTPTPGSGGVLRLPMPVNAPHDDPLNVNTEEMLYLFSLVYDSLIAVNDAGELTPCLCESWTSEGGGVWTLNLRESAKWQDGSGRLTAQDVVNTYKALCDMQDSYYYRCTKHIKSMVALNNSTLRVSMDVPGIIALYSLNFPIRKDRELMGTGAYRCSRATDTSIMLTANADWWDRRPYVDAVIFEARDSNETALASYEAGQLNMVPTNLLTAGKFAQRGVTNVLDVMTQGMEVLLFNNGIFASAEMRTAVARGINRSKVITNVYMNRARAADAPVPPDSWLYDSRSALLNYDKQRAEQILENEGWVRFDEEGVRCRTSGQKLKFTLLTSGTKDNTTRFDAASAIAASLAELGISIEIVTAEHSLGDAESPFARALAAGEWDLALVGFNLGLDCDPTPYVTRGGECNYTGCGDAQIAMLVDTMLRAETEEALREASYAFQAYFVESVPFVTLYFRLNSIVYTARLEGLAAAREPMLMAGEKDWYFSE